jgi:biotin carboxyl carrier protein
MDVLSPKDGTILNLAAVEGAALKAGDAICTLSGDEETIAMQRLTMAQSLLAIDQNLLSAAQVQTQRRIVQIAGEITAKYVDFAQAKLQFEQQAVNDGSRTDNLGVVQASAALQKALGEQEKATIALANFDFNVQQAQARQALALAQLPNEVSFVSSMQKRLTLNAPIAGTVRFTVAPGSFIKKGQTIATVT